MRCTCCNKPFTPTKHVKKNGKVEFEKYCKRCVGTPYTGFKYSEDHEYCFGNSDIDIISQCVEGNTLHTDNNS